MPLYRQAALLRRFGGDIAANTIAASMVRVGQAVQPVINLLRDTLLDSDIIYGDETTLQVLKEPGRRPQRGLATLGAEQGIVQKRYREGDGHQSTTDVAANAAPPSIRRWL
ncbi:hypothetical protein CBM2634_P190004 [Cupriavidus taiwanensis]|uniref:Transposase IS66 central domain-containing protein n=1 Tax=Cupriavidus taiwanensis TaxID=164546 RepID=A0A375JBE2_9BURK|nr:hypothetical protein CBM2634_P190004 [Cupriavidus taiwanensis]